MQVPFQFQNPRRRNWCRVDFFRHVPVAPLQIRPARQRSYLDFVEQYLSLATRMSNGYSFVHVDFDEMLRSEWDWRLKKAKSVASATELTWTKTATELQWSDKFIMIFPSWWFFRKTNGRIRLYYYDTSGWLVFVCCLEEIEDTKRHFEINWPLVQYII